MKNKTGIKSLILIILVLSLSVGSLTSCLFERAVTGAGQGGGESADGGDTIINVDEFDITINSGAQLSALAASKAVLSVVSVHAFFEVPQYSWTGGYAGTEQVASAGSGVIYKLDKTSGDAYVITNYHVVYNESSIEDDRISREINLYLYGQEYLTSDGTSYAIPATYVGGSMNYDIAVLKVEASEVLRASNARAADLADSDKVTILDTAIAIGNPNGEGIAATGGVISVESENIQVQIDSTVGAVEIRVMRTDAPVNSGNSGGGLFNERGELIGIVNAKSASSSDENMGYAIPSNVAKAIADNAIYYSNGSVNRCLLGITVSASKLYTEYDTESGKVYKMEDVVIKEISATSAVKELLSVGDTIKSITVDGVTHEVTRIHHVVDSMLYARVGSSVTMNIIRGGTEMNITVPITSAMLTKS